MFNPIYIDKFTKTEKGGEESFSQHLVTEKVGAWIILPSVVESQYSCMLETEHKGNTIVILNSCLIHKHLLVHKHPSTPLKFPTLEFLSLFYHLVSFFKLLRLPLRGQTENLKESKGGPASISLYVVFMLHQLN